MEKQKIKVAITQGDINGVGFELIIKTLSDNFILDNCIPIIYGSTKAAAFHKKTLDIQSFNVNVISNVSECRPKRVNIINCGNDEIKVELGQATKTSGEAAFMSIEAAVKDLKDGAVDVLLTAPINPAVIDREQFNFPGHTEYLEQVFGTKGDAITLLVNDVFKVAVLTGRAPLSEVSSLITEELIVSKITALNQLLIEDFAIRKPRIAVLGVNPLAGSDGVLGQEEIEIIKPALKTLGEKGIVCVGPLAADEYFGSEDITRYDAVVAMYYEQGTIPFKAIAKNRGVDFTAGLPIVRTAAIAGVDYQVAGQNVVSEESFRQALYLACDVFRSRSNYHEISSDPLKKQEHKKQRPYSRA